MSLDTDIRKALRSVLTTVPNLPVMAWENRAYTPVEDVPFCRETIINNDERPESLGPPTMVITYGEYQVDVFYPLNSGTFSAEDTAKAIKDVFPAGLFINQLVYVDGSRSETQITTDQFYMKPVRIKWRAYYFVDPPLPPP